MKIDVDAFDAFELFVQKSLKATSGILSDESYKRVNASKARFCALASAALHRVFNDLALHFVSTTRKTCSQVIAFTRVSRDARLSVVIFVAQRACSRLSLRAVSYVERRASDSDRRCPCLLLRLSLVVDGVSS